MRDVGTTGAPSNAWGPAGHDGLAYLLFYRREDVEGLEANGVGTGAGAGAEKEKKKEKMEKREQKGREKEQKGTGSVKSGRR